MTMVSMFNRLDELDRLIDEKAENLTSDELSDLDQAYENTWTEINAYQPPNQEVSELMLLLLMNRFESMASRGDECNLARGKINELFDSMEVVTLN